MEYTKIDDTTLEVSIPAPVIKRNYTREYLDKEISTLETKLAELNAIKAEMDKQGVVSLAEAQESLRLAQIEQAENLVLQEELTITQ